MGMANDMKKLADEILASYKIRADELQQRLKDNDSMVKDVQDMLQGFRNDHQEIVASINANAKKLWADMAKDEQDRLSSFKEMIDAINGTISKIQDEVVGSKISTETMLKDFSAAHQEMTGKMQEEFAADKDNRAAWNTDRLKSFNDMLQGIDNDINRIRKEVAGIFNETDNMLKFFNNKHSDMSAELKAELQATLEKRRDDTRALLNDFNKRLAEISKENQQMAKTLHAELNKERKDLAASDVQRLKDFKVTMGTIQGKVNEIQTFVNTFLGELKNERVQASVLWEKLAEVKANLSKSIVTEPEVKKAAAEEQKPAAPPVKTEPEPKKAESKPVEKEAEPKKKPAPKAEKPKEPVKEEKELTLEEKVLAHINKHPKGVRVSDMEEPLNETRMRIGFIAKELLDNGKVLKMENRYYPKSSKK